MDDDHIAPLPRVAIQAFCETADVKAAIQNSASDRRMAKVLLKVQDGGANACVEAYRTAPTPNVIVIEATGERGQLLAKLDELAQYCDAGTRVLVIGHVNDVILYRELVKRGVSDYLMAPVSVIDVIRSLSQLFAADSAAPLGRTIAVVGAKGGVGSSTIAHNMGFSIARDLGIATVIADLDLPFGTAGLDFNQDPPQGIAEAVFSPDRLDANFLDRLMSKCSDNLSLLAAPATLERLYDLDEDAFDRVTDLLRGAIPCIIFDMPHMWTAWTKRVLVQADEIVIVATPDLANLRNVKSLVDVVGQQRPNDRKPVLVINQVGMAKRPEIAAADFAKAIGIEPTAILPFDAQLFGTAANNGQMLAEVQAKSKSVDSIAEVARLVTGRSEAKAGRRSMLDPLLSRLRRKSA
jgi:pilus assembly protein CpaE